MGRAHCRNQTKPQKVSSGQSSDTRPGRDSAQARPPGKAEKWEASGAERLMEGMWAPSKGCASRSSGRRSLKSSLWGNCLPY